MIPGFAIPTLRANGLTTPQTTRILAYFADGQNTVTAIRALPGCSFQGGSGKYLEVYKLDTSLQVAYTGPFTNGVTTTTSVNWNTTAYPTLNTMFTGLYKCRTEKSIGIRTYQLNVRGKMRMDA